MKSVSLPFIQKLTFVLISIIALGYLAILGHSLLAPLLFSFLMALVLLPVANFFEKKLRFKRSLSTFLCMILMIVVVSGIMYFIVNQLSALWSDWPLLEKQVTLAFHDLQRWIADTFHLDSKKQLSYLNDSAEKALSTSAVVVATTLATLSSTFLFMGFTLLFTFFLLNYRHILFSFLISVFKEEHEHKVLEIGTQVQSIIKKYIVGLFIQMAIVTALSIIVLSLLGVKYSILLGLITGIFNVVPYLGIFTALLLSTLITFATAGLGKVVLLLIAYIALHTVDSNVIMPLVVGSKVKINPLIAFIGIIVGEMVWGISGMFLCIPYLAILKIIFDRIEELRPWGRLMGEGDVVPRKRRVYRITKKIQLEEQE